MVMSIGWNPFYKNTVRSVEVHILHDFAGDFYGAHMNLCILGFIREEYDYVSKESLIEDIEFDKEVAVPSTVEDPAVVDVARTKVKEYFKLKGDAHSAVEGLAKAKL